MLRPGLLALSLVCLVSTPLAAQPSLVRDVNPAQGDFSGSPVLGSFTSLGPRAVFVLSRPLEDSLRSIELWTTDGTDVGTERLLALPDDQGVRLFASKGQIAFFTVIRAQFPVFESSLWRTDGTEAGTFLLASGLAVSFQPAVFVGNSVVFSGCTLDFQQCEPWTSDGTVAGTRRLRDVTPGEFGSNPREFTAAGGFAYFFADAPDGKGLWRTDATPQGTLRVALLPTFSRPRNLIAAGNLAAAGARLYFMMGPEPLNGPSASLWTSDGNPASTAGTRAVPPFNRPRGRGPAVAQWIGTLGKALIFIGVDPAAGWQVYRTDGTPGGTRLLTAFSGEPFGTARGATLGDRLVFQGPGQRLWTTAGTRASTKALAPLALATEFGQPVFLVTQGRAVFAGSTLGEEKDVEPWVTDGTPGGTFKLADLCAGECSSFLQLGATLLGQVQFYVGGNLWGTDGTPEGTRLLARGAIPPENQLPAPIASARRRLVFAGFDEDSPPGAPILTLEVTNGTPEGTRTLDLRLSNGAGSSPRGFTPLRDGVFFSACSTEGAFWETHGTPETTVKLTDARRPCEDPSQRPVLLDGIVYFLGIRPTEFWYEVWRSDGTPEGTYEITQVGPEMSVDPPLVTAGGKLFFFTDVNNAQPTDHSMLWVSDGTPGGTREAFEFEGRYLDSLASVGDEIFFVAGPDPNERTLYVSDGTPEGTQALVRSSPVGDFTRIGGEVFYVATEPGDGSIYKTDGTPEGSLQLLVPGKRVNNIGDLGELGGRLFFMGIDIVDFTQSDGIPTLFRSDGTAAGTVALKTFDKDDPNVFPQVPKPQFTAAAGVLFFVAFDKAHGAELWKTDGTAAGTVLVRDIFPGSRSSRISALAGAGDRLFFAADDGIHGVELWTSDGTPAGTRLVADIAEGPRSSFPREITRIGNRVFFSADDGVVGREPWVLPLDSTLLGRIIP